MLFSYTFVLKRCVIATFSFSLQARWLRCYFVVAQTSPHTFVHCAALQVMAIWALCALVLGLSTIGVESKLNVYAIALLSVFMPFFRHVIAHTHDDTGWIQTVSCVVLLSSLIFVRCAD